MTSAEFATPWQELSRDVPSWFRDAKLGISRASDWRPSKLKQAPTSSSAGCPIIAAILSKRYANPTAANSIT